MLLNNDQKEWLVVMMAIMLFITVLSGLVYMKAVRTTELWNRCNPNYPITVTQAALEDIRIRITECRAREHLGHDTLGPSDTEDKT